MHVRILGGNQQEHHHDTEDSAQAGGQELSVVIAYDVRVFHDLRGLYHPDLPSPLLGMTSGDFARVAATMDPGIAGFVQDRLAQARKNKAVW